MVSFSTNYFKAFFFEAIVTVNLTALLVLTTMFISVTESLPKTAYIKMVDIWLLFNLFIPFAEVLLHTFIDSLRQDEDREINHHGEKRELGINGEEIVPKEDDKNSAAVAAGFGNDLVAKILAAKKKTEPAKESSRPGTNKRAKTSRRRNSNDLIARDEVAEIEARRQFYEEAEIINERQMMIATKVLRKGLPFLFVSFVAAYFAIGMSYYNRGIKDI